MSCLFRRVDTIYSCHADDLSIDLRQQLRIPVAFFLLFQERSFLFQGKSGFFGIGRQEFCFSMSKNEIVPCALRVLLCSVPYDAGPVVFRMTVLLYLICSSFSFQGI